MKAKRGQLLTSLSFVLLAVVVGLAGLLLAVLPQRSKTHQIDGQIAALQTKLATLHASSSRAPALRAADLFQLARAMPDSTDMPSVVLDLARAAGQSKVTLTSITPSAPLVQTDGSSAVPIHVVVDGKWAGIASFLRTLRLEVRATGEKLSVDGRLFVVDNVQLSTTGTDAVEATLNVNAFSYGVAPPPVDTSTTGTTPTTQSSPSGGVQAAGTTGSTG